MPQIHFFGHSDFVRRAEQKAKEKLADTVLYSGNEGLVWNSSL